MTGFSSSHFVKCQRRHILLLEVLIAFAIITLCIFPLIYPHAAIAKSQRTFIKKIELDHAVSLLFAQVYQDLYSNKITWPDIEKGAKFPITSDELQKLNDGRHLPYSGYYQFKPVIHKPKNNSTTLQETAAHIFNLIFTLYPDAEKKKGKALSYTYNIFIFHDLRSHKNQNETTDNENKN